MGTRVNLLCHKQTGTNPKWREGFQGIKWKGRSKAREFIYRMDKEGRNYGGRCKSYH